MSEARNGFIARDIERAVHRINALGSRSGTIPPEAHPLMREALTELSTLVEELETTSEELRLQNEHFEDARATIEEELDRYRGLFNDAPLPLLVTTPSGAIRAANRSAVSLLGVRPGELVGKPLAAFIPLSDRRAFRGHLLDVAAGVVRSDRTWRMNITPRGSAPLALDATCTAVRTGEREEFFWTLRNADPDIATTHDVHTAFSVDPALPDELVIALHDAESVDVQLDRLLRLLVPDVCDFCVIDLADNAGGRVRCAVMHRDAARRDLAAVLLAERSAVANSFCDLPFSTSAVRRFDDTMINALAGLDAEREALQGLGIETCLCVPMVVAGATFGTLFMGWCAGGPETAAEVRTLARAAERAGILLNVAVEGEARRRATEAVTSSLLSLAHDVIPPVHAIAGQLDALQDHETLSDPAATRSLQSIRNASVHLTAMVREVLAVARAEDALARDGVADVDAGGVLRELFLMLSPAAAAKGVVLELVVPEDAVVLRTNPTHLRRLIINLLDRSISDFGDTRLRMTLSHEGDGAQFELAAPGGAVVPIERASSDIGQKVLEQFVALLGGELQTFAIGTGGGIFTRLWIPLR